MLRYLRGKGFLDILSDGIRAIAPGRVGQVLAVAVVFPEWVGSMYVANYHTVAPWFSP